MLIVLAKAKVGEGAMEPARAAIADGTVDVIASGHDPRGPEDKRLPFADGSDADSLLRKLGLAPQFHAYPGLGHSISEGEISDLNAWLQRINR